MIDVNFVYELYWINASWFLLHIYCESVAGIITKPEDFDKYILKSGDGAGYICEICSYTQTQFGVVKNHVESKHFPNSFDYNCPLCDKVLTTNNAFLIHKRRYHQQ